MPPYQLDITVINIRFFPKFYFSYPSSDVNQFHNFTVQDIIYFTKLSPPLMLSHWIYLHDKLVLFTLLTCSHVMAAHLLSWHQTVSTVLYITRKINKNKSACSSTSQRDLSNGSQCTRGSWSDCSTELDTLGLTLEQLHLCAYSLTAFAKSWLLLINQL